MDGGVGQMTAALLPLMIQRWCNQGNVVHMLSGYAYDFGNRLKWHILVSLYKVDAKEGEHKVHEKELPRMYPREAVEASSTNPNSFRRLFLLKAANDVAKMFISYPPEEQHLIE